MLILKEVLLTTNISFSVNIDKPPSTNLGRFAVNLSTTGASLPLPSCRIYHSQITLNPMKNIQYIEETRNKKVTFRSVSSNQYNNNNNSGSNFNTGNN